MDVASKSLQPSSRLPMGVKPPFSSVAWSSHIFIIEPCIIRKSSSSPPARAAVKSSYRSPLHTLRPCFLHSAATASAASSKPPTKTHCDLSSYNAAATVMGRVCVLDVSFAQINASSLNVASSRKSRRIVLRRAVRELCCLQVNAAAAAQTSARRCMADGCASWQV